LEFHHKGRKERGGNQSKSLLPPFASFAVNHGTNMSENAFTDYRMFPAISEAWELERSGLVIIQEELYKLELWHSYSNPDIPYYVSISILRNDSWTRMPDPPFATGRDGDQALRDAMAFLTERLAA
jgi:hypothetical protein